MAPKKKTVERTAASSRPKRTPKLTTVTTSSAPAPKRQWQWEQKREWKPKRKRQPVKKAQNTIVNASPVKKVQDAFTGGSNRSKSPEKKMTSNDSGYQADNEQQSVMSRTWELAANAVEAMRSVVNPE